MAFADVEAKTTITGFFNYARDQVEVASAWITTVKAIIKILEEQKIFEYNVDFSTTK